MAIDSESAVFPNNAINVIYERAASIDSDLRRYRRPLKHTDPSESFSVYAAQWLPDEQSYEMRGQPIGRNEPSLQRYTLAVQAFVKDFSEERGLAKHSVLSTYVRAMLYRDEQLRVGLQALSTTLTGSTERTTRWGIRTQRFLSNEINKDFLYLSTLEFWLETETV